MMKSVLLFLFTSIIFLACEKETFTIKGKLDGYDEKKLVLVNTFMNQFDTVVVKDGNFTLKGKVDQPTLYVLFLEGEEFNDFSFYVENTLIKITGESGKIDEFSVMGGDANNEYNTWFGKRKKDYRKQNKKAYKEYNEAVAAKDTGKAKKVVDEMVNLEKGNKEFLKKYIEKNPKSYVAVNELASSMREYNIHEIENLIGLIDSSLNDYFPVEKLKNYHRKIKLVSINAIAPDFVQNDIDGKSVKLSEEYKKSKYLLIDFWASWCKPCRHENPNLVDAYKKYNRKGFGILGVSLDIDTLKWKKAIEKDKLTWIQVSDLKGWNNQVARQYMVNGIPANFLVDNNGKIIAQDLREEKLQEKLDELFNQ